MTEEYVLQITPWERLALQLLAEGTAITSLAEHFGTSQREVDIRLAVLFSRMGVKSRAEAVEIASRRGLLMLVPEKVSA